ncbi:MAG: hypothetical protein Terrestrivirus5_6 [Terrestrivirus sp.]|uniref:Peptidase M48 domain-containing protein n=1 Tax=Terrestrivirus sp. TaxID=2487775 RepID=A0A3G4ZP54_9VIRU|nr:MAG: hypothetical protein Terrestrivirus5_6 [Terrestrivirus sp.]
MEYFLPPAIEFDETIQFNSCTKERLKTIISHSLCLNDMNKMNVEIINLTTSYGFFGATVDNKRNNEIIGYRKYNKNDYPKNVLTIEVPSDLEYKNDNNSWECTIKYHSFGILCETEYLSMSEEQLVVILCHEINHFKYGDLNLNNRILMGLYNLTTNPILLSLSCYFFGTYILFTVVGFNHLYAMRSRQIEKRADVNTFHLKHDMKRNAKQLWIQFKNNKSIKKSLFHSSLQYCFRMYHNIFCGMTHPTMSERIKYCS